MFGMIDPPRKFPWTVRAGVGDFFHHENIFVGLELEPLRLFNRRFGQAELIFRPLDGKRANESIIVRSSCQRY